MQRYGTQEAIRTFILGLNNKYEIRFEQICSHNPKDVETPYAITGTILCYDDVN